ncbi:hypothetical protein ACHAWF_006475 [Thalassiosira exigua]
MEDAAVAEHDAKLHVREVGMRYTTPNLPRKRRKNADGASTAGTARDRASAEGPIAVCQPEARSDAVPPPEIPPDHPDHVDLNLLSLTQLEAEIPRLEARLVAARDRLKYLLATGKRPRKRCKVNGCLVVASGKGGMCQRHSGYKDRCNFEGCEKWAQRGGRCYSHGAQYRLCGVEGCTKKVQNSGRCFRHGAKKPIRKQKAPREEEEDLAGREDELGWSHL